MKKTLLCSSNETNVHFSKKTQMSCFDSPKLISNNKLLLEAVKSGKDCLVQSLIHRGVSISISDQFGGHPLYYAARHNHRTILEMLLQDTSTLIDHPTKMLRTPLQIASYHGHSNLVEILIENKANVDLTDSLEMSALHWAAENNHPEVVRILLKAGANRTLMNKFGKTALCLASEKNNYDVCDILQDVDKLNNIRFLNGDKLDSRDEKSHYNQYTKEKLRESETIKLFEQHGIKLIPVDQSTVIANALKRGQTAVLTEAGKLALKKTEPEFLRTISNMTNTASNAFTRISPHKKMKVEKTISNELNVVENITKHCGNEINPHRAKGIKIDTKKSINLVSRKKFIMTKPSRANTATSDQKQLAEKTPSSSIFSSCSEQKTDSTEAAQLQLQNQMILIRDMKRQLEMSMRLVRYYKTKYEAKGREAESYKAQLGNLSTLLTKSGFQIVNIKP